MPETVWTIDVKAADRDHVPGGLDGFLLCFALDRLDPLGGRTRRQISQLLQDPERIVFEEHRQIGIAIPCVDDRALVDLERLAGERRHVRPRLLQFDVALARLLGVVEGIPVQDAPHELARDVFEAELEVGVLIDGVMACLERERADRVALAIRDFVDGDDPRRIARPRGGNRAVERVLGRIAQRDQRRCGRERGAD